MSNFGFLFGIILYLIYMGWIYESVGFMTLAYMTAVLFVLSFFVIIYRKCTIKGKIQVPIGISEIGKPNTIKLIITNNSAIPLTRIKAVLIVEDTLTKAKRKCVMRLPVVTKGAHTFESSVILNNAGNYEIILKSLRVYDFTGLFYGRVKVAKAKVIQIMPKFIDVPVTLTEATMNFYGESDIYEDERAGHDNSELFQVREFKAGDRLQNIHWKMSAKQDDLMVKEQAMPKSCPVVLFLDYKGYKKHNKNMIAFMQAAFSISFSLMDAGCNHYVTWYNSADNDLVRVRIDSDESLYYYIELVMKNKWMASSEDIAVRYKEKYCMEPYVWKLTLDESLELKKQDETIIKYSPKELEKDISSVEILL